MAGLTKSEGGVSYPARCFLDRPNPRKPSTWSLRVYELVHGDIRMTKNQLGRAATALHSEGFLGNRHGKNTPGKSIKELKDSLVARYREIGVLDKDIPSYLFPAGHLAHAKKGPTDVGFFEHYGVRGMKWGVRKSRSTKGQKLSAKAKKMSDDNLKTSIKRMQMERQYSDLVTKEDKANQTRMSRGKASVEKAMKDAGQETLKSTFAKGMLFGVGVGVTQASKTSTGKTIAALADK